jgi:hypothetical protein
MHSLVHTVKHLGSAKHHDHSSAANAFGSKLSERLALMGWLAACVALPMWLALRF